MNEQKIYEIIEEGFSKLNENPTHNTKKCIEEIHDSLKKHIGKAMYNRIMGKEKKELTIRYEGECQQLLEMAKNTLNLPKNACKGNFEDLLSIEEILELLENEVEELNYEFWKVFSSELKEKINFSRAREELADVVGCCVGLLAKLNSMEKGINK